MMPIAHFSMRSGNHWSRSIRDYSFGMMNSCLNTLNFLRAIYWTTQEVHMPTIKEPKMRLGAQPDPRYHVQQGSLWRDARTHEELKPVIYDALCQFWDENDYAPSYRELAKMAHVLSLSTVKIISLELEIEGKVRRTNSPMRMLVPVRGGNDES